jgi:hypothetical protein
MKVAKQLIKSPNGPLLNVDIVSLQSGLLQVRGVAELAVSRCSDPTIKDFLNKIIQISKQTIYEIETRRDTEGEDLKQTIMQADKSGQVSE